MKRWPIILLLSLAVIVVLSPGIVGHLAEKSIDEQLSSLEADNNDIVITVENFDSGWFTSAGRHRVTLREDSPLWLKFAAENPVGGRIPSLVIDTELDHGLVVLSSLGREQASLLPGLANSVSTLKIDLGEGELIDLPGTIYSTIGLSGDMDFHFLMEPGTHAEDNSSVAWTGADITVNTDAGSRSFRARGRIEPTTFKSQDVTTEMGSISFDITQEQGLFELALGKLALDIDSFSVTGPAQADAGSGKISIEAVNELSGDRLNNTSALQLNDVMIQGLGVMNLDLDVAFGGIDAAALVVLINTLRDAQENMPPGAALPDMSAQLSIDLERLVAKGLEFDIRRFDVSVPQGSLSKTLNISVAEIDDVDSFSWPGAILATTASADLTVSASLYKFAQAMQPQAATLVAMGILKRSGDHYEMQVRFEKGLLSVNGLPMPIPLGGAIQ